VSHEDVVALEGRDADLFEDFQESDFRYSLNGYDYNTDYFFGLDLIGCYTGRAVEIPVAYKYDRKLLAEMLDEFKKYFPGRDNYVPRSYVMCILS
jgi:hypothetical protein